MHFRDAPLPETPERIVWISVPKTRKEPKSGACWTLARSEAHPSPIKRTLNERQDESRLVRTTERVMSHRVLHCGCVIGSGWDEDLGLLDSGNTIFPVSVLPEFRAAILGVKTGEEKILTRFFSAARLRGPNPSGEKKEKKSGTILRAALGFNSRYVLNGKLRCEWPMGGGANGAEDASLGGSSTSGGAF
ncbi:hypothetical protein JTE90_026765 [Oedothorax gibbosus]|uniref:Uncharacterized protein n=1 Tax=Oedothorax gibbosus TaxID=931172 RepID=A0AAV6UWG4_9ARAC|nr:hypothetical protein JTE90_026765 [Oedothorax gibbosus]